MRIDEKKYTKTVYKRARCVYNVISKVGHARQVSADGKSPPDERRQSAVRVRVRCDIFFSRVFVAPATVFRRITRAKRLYRADLSEILGGLFLMSKKTYYITFTAVFAALGIAMNLLSSFMPRVDTFGRISLVYAFCFLTGCVLGPYLGAGVAAIADFLPAIIFPEGPWMPLITLSNAVMALIAGLFYKYLPTKSVAVKISLAAVVTFVVCTLGLTTLGEALLYDMGMQAYYPTTTALVNSGMSVYVATLVRKAVVQWFWLLLNTVVAILILKCPAVVRFFRRKSVDAKNAA